MGQRNGRFKQRIDLTSPVEWWKQLKDDHTFMSDPSDAVTSGRASIEDPSTDMLPIFDDGFFWEYMRVGFGTLGTV